jgi:hypothetical protein
MKYAFVGTYEIKAPVTVILGRKRRLVKTDITVEMSAPHNFYADSPRNMIRRYSATRSRLLSENRLIATVKSSRQIQYPLTIRKHTDTGEVKVLLSEARTQLGRLGRDVFKVKRT